MGDGVPLLVPFQFRHPEILVGFRHSGQRAMIMSMPEASMHKNHLPAAREYQIGLAGQLRAVQAVAVAGAMHESSNQHLRAGVLRLDPRHKLASFGSADGIGHKINGCAQGGGWRSTRPIPWLQGYAFPVPRREPSHGATDGASGLSKNAMSSPPHPDRAGSLALFVQRDHADDAVKLASRSRS